jgi:hypothetical protein
MNDKDILKLKFGLLTVSLIFLLTGSRLLFGSWTSIHLLFWIIIASIIYFGVYATYRSMTRKNTQTIFNGFEVIGAVTIVGIIALTTIMFLIFYPLISFLFFGLTLATLVLVGGLKFITFDYNKNTVDGLFENGGSSLTSMTVDIHSDNTKIEIRTPDKDDILILKKEIYGDKVWTQLIENFQKINGRT